MSNTPFFFLFFICVHINKKHTGNLCQNVTNYPTNQLKIVYSCYYTFKISQLIKKKNYNSIHFLRNMEKQLTIDYGIS